MARGFALKRAANACRNPCGRAKFRPKLGAKLAAIARRIFARDSWGCYHADSSAEACFLSINGVFYDDL